MDNKEIMDKIAEMENELAELKKEINKQEEPERRWKPKMGRIHWFIDSDGSIFFCLLGRCYN